MRIRARAIRRGGELLKEHEKAKNQHDAANKSAEAGGDPCTRKAAAEDAGLSASQPNLTFAKPFGKMFTDRMTSTLPTITAISKAYGISRQTFYAKSSSLTLSKTDWLSPQVVFERMLATGNTSPLRTHLSIPINRHHTKTKISKL